MGSVKESRRAERRAEKGRERKERLRRERAAQEARFATDERLETALALAREGFREEAGRLAKSILERAPTCDEAAMLVVEWLQDDPERQFRVLRAALEKGTPGPVLRFMIARRLFDLGRGGDALPHLEALGSSPEAQATLERFFQFPHGAALSIQCLLFEAQRLARSSPPPIRIVSPRRRTGEGAAPPATHRPARNTPPPPASSAMRTEAAPPEIDVRVRFEESIEGTRFVDLLQAPSASIEDTLLVLEAARLATLAGFDSLFCLDDVLGLERFEYQIETALRVLRVLRGRALLADEVGLGKTIEASLVLKEYVVRGLVERALILVPQNLVSQWVEELATKFRLEFASTLDRSFRRDPKSFWRTHPRVVASIATARSRRHAPAVSSVPWDLVIVDEAHHLRSRSSLAWKLVSELPRKFLLLLTATPVQNDMVELYNLITLLAPGTLETPTAFRKRYVEGRDARKAKHPEELRRLLAGVMIRNTRSRADVELPPRFASTHVVTPPPAERELYALADAISRRAWDLKIVPRPVAASILRAAGSSPAALARSAARLAGRLGEREGGVLVEELAAATRLARDVGETAKTARLLEILAANQEKVIVFTHFRATIAHLAGQLGERGIPLALFHGSLTGVEKDAALTAFRGEARVLLSTESGGEGRNLQFCRSMVNFDLPYNPMRIEQRIGRIHRIGQEREVHVFNLALAGSIEEEILRILDEKLALFELVVGETGTVLGQLPHRKEFEELALEMWFAASTPDERRASFDRLGQEVQTAREGYETMRELDRSLFHEDYVA